MDISKIIRKNKNFVKPEDITSAWSRAVHVQPISNLDKVRQILSDGKWHSRKGLVRDTKMPSQGNMHSMILQLTNNDEIISGTCQHCDGAQILYRLK